MKKQYYRQRGINPALQAMTEEQKNNRLIMAAEKANLILTIMVLHDKFQFGTKRLEKFLKEYWELLDSYERGYFKMAELEAAIKEETGIEVKL